jgi:hypothetical protein
LIHQISAVKKLDNSQNIRCGWWIKPEKTFKICSVNQNHKPLQTLPWMHYYSYGKGKRQHDKNNAVLSDATSVTT